MKIEVDSIESIDANIKSKVCLTINAGLSMHQYEMLFYELWDYVGLKQIKSGLSKKERLNINF